MLISKQWVEQYIDLSDLTAQEVADALTLRVAEVEEIQDRSKSLNNIVVGKITQITEHPNADALRCCTVDVGNEELPVVCGGSNIAEGQLIAMGKVGAQVRWHGEGELIELTKAKIRGEVSFGMICAAEEIGLGDMFPAAGEREILDLSHLDVATGTPLAVALGMNDVVFDIENKTLTHRPDLWGHYGMAREIGALLNKKVAPYKTTSLRPQKDVHVIVKVEDIELCPRYMAVAMDNITVAPSPAWLQERLVAAGMNPINNIVDITNYVMLDLGQPMHAFDRDNLASPDSNTTIIVRRATSEEVFTTLDDKEMVLTNDMLVIADTEKAVALAGVKGGKNSGITEKTTEIVLESANFHPSNTRRTATLVGLRTDSSARFEKSLDPTMCQTALERAVELIMEVCPDARITSNIADENHSSLETGPIEVSQQFLDNKIGHHIPLSESAALLERLGFGVKIKKDVMHVTIPTWRATKDISIREDIAEEIIRLYGYEQIPSRFPVFTTQPPHQIPLRALSRKLRDWLSHEFRYTEVYNYSFVSPEWLKKLGMKTDRHLALDNPIAKDRPLVRRYLIPNMIECVGKNLHRFHDVRLFEIGKTFDVTEQGDPVAFGSEERLPLQDTHMIVMRAQKGNEKPFFNLVSVVSGIMERLGVQYAMEEATPDGDWEALIHPTRYANIMVNGQYVGGIGELHPLKQKELGFDARVGMLHLHLSGLVTYVGEPVGYSPVGLYPSIERDVAILVDRKTKHADIAQALTAMDDLIVETAIFDVYEGKGIPEGMKSMAYRLVYRSDDRTLEASEVDAIQQRVQEMLVNDFGAEIR